MADALRADANYTAQFDRPVFLLQARWADFCSAAFERFRPHIRPDEIRFDTGAQPSDFVAKCDLVDLGVAIRFRLTNLDLWTRSIGGIVKGDHFLHLVTQSLTVLDDLEARVVIANHVFALGIHCRLGHEYAGRKGFLERWVASAPEGFEVSGATFAALEEGVRVVVEPSLLYPDADAAFIRISCELPGTTPVAEAYERFTMRAENARRALGLELTP